MKIYILIMWLLKFKKVSTPMFTRTFINWFRVMTVLPPRELSLSSSSTTWMRSWISTTISMPTSWTLVSTLISITNLSRKLRRQPRFLLSLLRNPNLIPHSLFPLPSVPAHSVPLANLGKEEINLKVTWFMYRLLTRILLCVPVRSAPVTTLTSSTVRSTSPPMSWLTATN